MKMNEINIRDPYILLHNGTYYLYGTRSATTWGPAFGFDAYTSDDLENWNGPYEIFKKYEGFWADRCYWAPECYFYDGKFYLVTTFASETENMGTQILVSDSPLGPFKVHSDGPVTPREWKCLDGTLYFDEEGTPYMVYGHSFQDNPEGEMYVVELSKDLKSAVGEHKLLFKASEPKWSTPIPFAKKEFGIEEDAYFIDGPCLHKTESGRLLMLWSSWGKCGYAVGMAYSKNNKIDGEWVHIDEPFYGENGGHGMLFKDKSGKLCFSLHYPNDLYSERPIIREVEEIENLLVIK